ncbi:MAG: hypothetical protein QW104_03310 [Nitrososphaerota archaeon]
MSPTDASIVVNGVSVGDIVTVLRSDPSVIGLRRLKPFSMTVTKGDVDTVHVASRYGVSNCVGSE